MRFLPGNAQHIGARHSQQDSFGFADPDDREFIAHGGFLTVVCDGMGGMEYGDAASRTAVRAFLDAYQRKTPEESIPEALERSVRDANGHVVALAHSLGLAEGIGTTLVAAALDERSLYFISVGDSGVFLCCQGEIRTLNRPHIFANVLDAAVARGALSREDAQNHPERESLTSFIGAERLEEIDRNIEPIPVDAGDTVLLASDGMFKTLNAVEIQESLEGAPQGWPEALVERTIAKQREYQDNVTVVSVTLESEDRASGLPRTVVRKPVAAPPRPTGAAPIPPPAWTPPVPAAPPPPAKGRGVSWWPIVLNVLVLAAGAAGWWYLKHRANGPLTDSPPVTDPNRVRPTPALLPPDGKPDPNARPAAGTAPFGSSAPAETPTPTVPSPAAAPSVPPGVEKK